MKTISLAKGGFNKVRSHQFELKSSDLQDSLRSLTPGEWCSIKSENSYWIGFVNPLVDEKFPSVQILKSIAPNLLSCFSVEAFITEMIEKAINRRKQFKHYLEGCRLFYGFSDGLPGLIVDSFQDAAIIQINTAGLDRHRKHIHQTFEAILGRKCYLLDNPKYREREHLPTYEMQAIPEVKILENELSYTIRSEVMQKVGFYYDHRENRKQLVDLLLRLNRSFDKGLDLFCYAGAWGMNALKGGVKLLDFVDQGDFATEINKSLDLNDFKSRGSFYRSDVFKFLDQVIQEERTYDVVLCDPPAFAKSSLQKAQALDGYSKLHRKVLKILSPGALVVFSSCTHYVSHEEFQKNILDASHKEGKKLQLIHSGIQGWDHPVSSLSDKANYIKSYFYILET